MGKNGEKDGWVEREGGGRREREREREYKKRLQMGAQNLIRIWVKRTVINYSAQAGNRFEPINAIQIRSTRDFQAEKILFQAPKYKASFTRHNFGRITARSLEKND